MRVLLGVLLSGPTLSIDQRSKYGRLVTQRGVAFDARCGMVMVSEVIVGAFQHGMTKLRWWPGVLLKYKMNPETDLKTSSFHGE